MNKDDKKHIELVDYKIDELKQDISELKSEVTDAHKKTDESLRFIKENLFNPNEGLWAETKKNTTHRENTNKWRGVVGTGFVGLLVKQIYDLFTQN
tara:strand:+ start:1186 stop:1473 length:288 start_codon:yes stop_codon:yes gene_type:complete